MPVRREQANQLERVKAETLWFQVHPRDRLQIWLLILSAFNRINQLLFPLKPSENLMVSREIEIWKRSFNSLAHSSQKNILFDILTRYYFLIWIILSLKNIIFPNSSSNTELSRATARCWFGRDFDLLINLFLWFNEKWLKCEFWKYFCMLILV